MPENRDCRTCKYQIIFDYFKHDEFTISCCIGQLNWKKCKGEHYREEDNV